MLVIDSPPVKHWAGVYYIANNYIPDREAAGGAELPAGDAAVAAGIVSPIVIIIVATTSICELVFYDQDIIDALREWRIIFILASAILGIIGVVIAFIMFISKLCSLKCLNAYYLTPFSPLNINMLKDSIVRFDRKKLKKRPSIFTKNLKRMDDVNEENTN